LRATGFHASGAVAVVRDLAPFDGTFERDPGDGDLVARIRSAVQRLALDRLVPADDALEFERLWRIRAAGGDRLGTVTDPVLCRAVGSFRHIVRGLPVYGRASATVEQAADGRLSSLSVSTRRFAGDGGGRTMTTVAVRSPRVAANDVVAQIVDAFGDIEELTSTRLVAEWFRFGYLSLGRRRRQGLLAPFYIASVAVERKSEASAHVIAVPATDEEFVRLPAGRPAAALGRSTVAV
jgi:hypothetical protein